MVVIEKMINIKSKPTNVERVLKINSANVPKNIEATPINLPAILVFRIKYNANGNLINKLAAITFLLPLLPTIDTTPNLLSVSDTIILN